MTRHTLPKWSRRESNSRLCDANAASSLWTTTPQAGTDSNRVPQFWRLRCDLRSDLCASYENRTRLTRETTELRPQSHHEATRCAAVSERSPVGHDASQPPRAESNRVTPFRKRQLGSTESRRATGLDDEDRTRLRRVHGAPRSPDRYVQHVPEICQPPRRTWPPAPVAQIAAVALFLSSCARPTPRTPRRIAGRRSCEDRTRSP